MLWFYSLFIICLPKIAVSLEESVCGKSQCSDAQKFHYSLGSTYEYEYVLKNSIGRGGHSEHSELDLLATVLLSPLSTCEFVIQLTDVTTQPPGKSLKDTLEKHPITFTFQDGQVDNVCSHPEDEVMAINIKKGIISAMQNTMVSLEEEHMGKDVDLSGSCPTTYTLDSSDWFGPSIIVREKDLTQCTDRGMETVGLIGAEMWANQLPLIKSSQVCRQEIEKHRIKVVSCEEINDVVPFSNQGPITKSITTQILSLRGERDFDNAELAELSEKQSLLPNKKVEKASEKNFMEAEETLKELTVESRDHVKLELTSTFTKLISVLESLTFSQLRDLYKVSKESINMMKLFVDAITVTRSGPAIALMQELAVEGVVNAQEASLWYTSLAFTTKPDVEMIEASLAILSGSFSKQAVLGVSGLLNQFCTIHPDCENVHQVQEILNRFKVHLGSSCRSSTSELEDKILVALKAIGNAGRIGKLHKTVLKQCSLDRGNSVAVRVAALQALRHVACDDIDTSSLVDMLSDVMTPAGIGINAYQSLLHCLDTPMVSDLERLLHNQPVNQVTSYIWTHISNMDASSNGTTGMLKTLSSNPSLKIKFEGAESLKPSKRYNVPLPGADVQFDMIFEDTFVPQAASVNLGVDLFGNRLSLFEMGGRLQNADVLLEHIFGKNGYFPEEHVASILSSMREKQTQNQNLIPGSNMAAPTTDAFLKILGKEIVFGRFRDFNDVQDTFPNFNIIEMMNKIMKDKKIDYSKASQLINARITLLTGSGLPLSVSLSATSLVRLKAQLDTQMSETATIVKIQVKPSAVIEVNGKMIAELGTLTTGVETLATMNTATSLDVGFTYKQGIILNANIGLPDNKQDIIKIKTLTNLISNHERKTLKTDHPWKKNFQGCTSETISRHLGLQLCTQAKVKSSLIDPSEVSVFLEKTDDFSEYLFEVKQVNYEGFYKFVVIIDTPGSNVDRLRSFNVALDKTMGKVQLKIHTDDFDLNLAGRYNTGAKHKADLILSLNKEQLFSLHTAVEPIGTDGSTFKPKLTLRILREKIFALRGFFGFADSVNPPTSENSVRLDGQLLEHPVTFAGLFSFHIRLRFFTGEFQNVIQKMNLLQ